MNHDVTPTRRSTLKASSLALLTALLAACAPAAPFEIQPGLACDPPAPQRFKEVNVRPEISDRIREYLELADQELVCTAWRSANSESPAALDNQDGAIGATSSEPEALEALEAINFSRYAPGLTRTNTALAAQVDGLVLNTRKAGVIHIYWLQVAPEFDRLYRVIAVAKKNKY